jgi:hypothetical protein
MQPDHRGTATHAGIALGLGLTNECNLACAFCYRDPARADRLSLDEVKSVMERLPVRLVNLGTGENGMHPDFKAILAYLSTQPVKLTITSNGHSVAVLDDSELRAFHDIEFSLDYPTQAEQDAQRGGGNWALIHQQAKRCVKLGVPVHRGRHDEIKLPASGGRGAGGQTVWRSLAGERVSERAIGPLCADVRRVLARVRASLREHRCD